MQVSRPTSEPIQSESGPGRTDLRAYFESHSFTAMILTFLCVRINWGFVKTDYWVLPSLKVTISSK